MRRRWRAASGATVATLLALVGCDGEVDGTQEVPRQNVEVYSWWTAGAQADGLQALAEEFEQANPELRFVNVASDVQSAEQARPVLEERLAGHEPPDAFQGRAGADLSRFIEAGEVRRLDDFYAEQELFGALPRQLIEQLRYRGPAAEQAPAEEDASAEQGPFYSVPVSVHRSNLLWYNPQILEEAGVETPGNSLTEFLEALRAVDRETDVAPLAVGPSGTVDQLLENVLLSELGAEAYNALWLPDAEWDGPELVDALQTFADVLAYAEPVSADATWRDAADQVVDAEAAFYVMGDWTVGHFEEQGYVAREDFGWVPTPGTEGVYLWFADSFALTADAPNEDGARAWLNLVASREGQDIINPAQGSIPARRDGDLEAYTDSEYLSWAMAEWQEAELAGSFRFGASASATWRGEIDAALRAFTSTGSDDVADLHDELQRAAAVGTAELRGDPVAPTPSEPAPSPMPSD